MNAPTAPTLAIRLTCPHCGPFHLTIPAVIRLDSGRLQLEPDTDALRLALSVHSRQHMPEDL